MKKATTRISITPLPNLPLIQKGDDLVNLVIHCLKRSGEVLLDNDILVVCHKVVSKSEGTTVDLNEITPSPAALELAREVGKDPRMVHLVLKESKRIVRKRYGLLIMEHKKGWICANAGMDYSNVPDDCVALLPRNPFKTAERIRQRISESLKVDIAVLISDSQGRPFRNGIVGVALGYAGMPGLISKAGEDDLYHYKLQSTEIALADQLASAALLVMGESNERVPVAIVRGLEFQRKKASAHDLIRAKENDLFR